MSRKTFIIIGSLLLVLTLIVWKTTKKETLEATKSSGTIIKETKEDIEKDMETNELKKKDLVVGTGLEAVTGKKVTVNYSGTLTDGTKFDSSYDRGVPFSFSLGAGEVIEGWDLGVVGMKVGGKRKLTIPASLAYGDRSPGGGIGPGATLVFEVELLEVE